MLCALIVRTSVVVESANDTVMNFVVIGSNLAFVFFAVRGILVTHFNTSFDATPHISRTSTHSYLPQSAIRAILISRRFALSKTDTCNMDLSRRPRFGHVP